MRRVLTAWKEAQRVLNDHGVVGPKVPVEKIAAKYANIVYQSLDSEISGILVPLERDRWAIIVNSDHIEVRQRFTIAHELGHLLLHGYDTPHADRSFKFRDTRSSEGTAIDEIQANQFAAELLMPRTVLVREVGSRTFDHAVDDDPAFELLVNRLAKKFGVSKQAMTIRLSSLFA